MKYLNFFVFIFALFTVAETNSKVTSTPITEKTSEKAAVKFYEDGQQHLEMTFSTNKKKVILAADFPLIAKGSNGYTPTMTIETMSLPYNFKFIIESKSVEVTGDTYRGNDVVVTPKIGTFSGSMMYYGTGIDNSMSFDPPSGWPATIEIVKYEAPYIWFKFSCANRHGTFEGFGEKIKFVGKY